MTVEAVIFDWGGTLTPWHPIDLEDQWRVFARAAHPDSDAAHVESVAAQLFSSEDRAWGRGRTSHQSASLEWLLADSGLAVDQPHVQAGLSAYREFWEPHTLTDPQVRPLWEGLRERGIKVGVLSNTIWSRDYHRGIFERDSVLDLIDGDVYSSEIEWIKPHAAAFEAACAAIDADPARSVYVGDRIYEDVHGPQQIGMRAIWIPHSDLPPNQVVAVDATPDAVARELLDILPIVDGWQT